MQVIKLNGDHLTFKGRVYGSVGIEYRIEYDKTANTNHKTSSRNL